MHVHVHVSNIVLAHIVRHDSQPGRPTGKFTQPCEDESVSIAQDTKSKAEQYAQLPTSEFGTTTRKGRAPCSSLRIDRKLRT